jgi:hypothetical protein
MSSASPKYFIMLLKGVTPADSPVVDFTKTATIELGEVESGRYDMVLFAFSTIIGEYFIPEMTFDLPLAGAVRTAWIAAQKPKAPSDQNHTTNTDKIVIDSDGASITMLPGLLEISRAITLKPDGTHPLKQIIFGGSVRKMASSYALDDFILGAPHVGETETGKDRHFLFVPFEGGVTIPDNANAVRFEISWDVDGLIEQYKGADGNPNTEDDIFVLKKDWWDGFNIRAVVE